MIYVSPPVTLAPEDRWNELMERRKSDSNASTDLALLASFVMVDIAGDEAVADVPADPKFESHAALLGGRKKDGRWLFPAGKLHWVRTLCERFFGHRGDNNTPLLRFYGPNECPGGSALVDGGLVLARLDDAGVIELGAGVILEEGALIALGEGSNRQIAAGNDGAILKSVISSAYSDFLAARVMEGNQSSRRHSKSKAVGRKRRVKTRS